MLLRTSSRWSRLGDERHCDAKVDRIIAILPAIPALDISYGFLSGMIAGMGISYVLEGHRRAIGAPVSRMCRLCLIQKGGYR
jgi:hypothetical protein